MLHRRLRVLWVLAQSLGLFAVFYYYLFFRIRLELFYQQKPHVFVFESHFFRDMVTHPGGVVDYLAAFLSPLLAWDWLGALVVSLLAALICWATFRLFADVAGADGEVVCLLPAILILMVAGQYIHPIQLCVGLGITLLAANLYTRLDGYRAGVRLAAFALASMAVHFVTAGLYAMFACLCGWREWSIRRQRWLGAVCVLCAAIVPYAASWWPFDLILSDAFRGLLLPMGDHWLAIPSSMLKAIAIYTAALTFPLLAAMFFSWRRRLLSQAFPNQKDSSDDTGTTVDGEAVKKWGLSPFFHSLGPNRRSWRARLMVPLAMSLLLVFADLAAFDSPKRCLLEIEYASEQGRWDDVLAWAKELPFPDTRACDPQILYCINRALYFRGGLLDNMFAFPQVCSTPSLALIHKDIDTTSRLTPRQCSEIFFDLGRVNESEQMAYEALEECGNRPEILKRLAYIYMIKGEREAARRFVLLLDRSLLHRGWARQVLQQLDSDPTLSAPWLVAYRETVVQRDSLGAAGNLETLLKGLLERNPRNRMALEYLMAHYLLTRQTSKVFADRCRLDALDYARYPRHIEEALAYHLAVTRQVDLDLGSRSIRPETWQRFVQFLDVERQSAGDPAAAFAALYPDFHHTYFFSLVFGHNIPSLGPARAPK